MEDALAVKMVVGGMAMGKTPVRDVRSALQMEMEYVGSLATVGDWNVPVGDMRSSFTVGYIVAFVVSVFPSHILKKGKFVERTFVNYFDFVCTCHWQMPHISFTSILARSQ